MREPNETYAKIQTIRIKNLEQQVHLMHRELQRLRDGMLHQNDAEKLSNLMDGLKELNLILTDLGSYYNCMQQSMFKHKKNMPYRNDPAPSDYYTVEQKESNHRYNVGNFEKPRHRAENNMSQENNFERSDYKRHQRENAGFEFEQNKSSPETSREGQLSKRHTEASKEGVYEPFKTCKQLMDEIKPPSSILGKYLVKLQDFRTDPELRRQRWEKKQKEKLKQLQNEKHKIPSLYDKTTETEDVKQNIVNNVFQKYPETSEHKKHDEKLRDYTSSSSQLMESDSSLPLKLPVIKNNLSQFIDEIINGTDRQAIALTIVLENDLAYHVSVSQISNGNSLACFLATEEAIQEAKQQHLFEDLLTFFVVNSENSDSQKDRILGHLFEFIKTDVK